MLSFKTRDITKCVIVAIIASLLCAYIFLPLVSVSLVEAVSAIEKAWITDCHAKALLIIYGMGAAEAIGFGVSGLLMSVCIGFVSKNNRMLTTVLALLMVTIIYIIYSLEIVPNIPQEYRSSVLIRLGLRFLLSMVFFWGCAFLGVWLVSRSKHKTSQQSLPDESTKAATQP